jgi:hypothetical protein
MLDLLTEILLWTDFLTLNEHFQVVSCCKLARKSFIRRVWWQKHRLPFVKPEEYKHVRTLKFVCNDEYTQHAWGSLVHWNDDFTKGFKPSDFQFVSKLITDGYFGSKFNAFPNALRSLTVVGKDSFTLQCSLPASLTSLIFNDNFDQLVTLRPNLTSLVLGANFNHHVHFPIHSLAFGTW